MHFVCIVVAQLYTALIALLLYECYLEGQSMTRIQNADYHAASFFLCEKACFTVTAQAKLTPHPHQLHLLVVILHI